MTIENAHTCLSPTGATTRRRVQNSDAARVSRPEPDKAFPELARQAVVAMARSKFR
jgi:hypothetical protein